MVRVAPRRRGPSVLLMGLLPLAWQSWRPALSSSRRLFCSPPTRASLDAATATGPVVLLIDGDHIGPRWFNATMTAVRRQGKVIAARCFGAPHIRKSWSDAMRCCGINFTAVERTVEGEPNDLAICEAADRIAASSPDTVIAIASKDRDFIQHHVRMRQRGIRSMAVVPYMTDVLRCRDAGIDVVKFDVDRDQERERVGVAEVYERYFNETFNETAYRLEASVVHKALQRLGYMLPDDNPFPTARSLGLFFEVNGVKGVELYPRCIGAHLAMGSLTVMGDDVLPNPGGLNFFEARIGRQRPGVGGTWLVAPTTPGIVPRILEWLGYTPGALNSPTCEEELEVFWRQNAKSFRNNLKGCNFPSPNEQVSMAERLAFLERAFTVEGAQQQWRPPPHDEDVRGSLVRARLLSSHAAPQGEVREALASFLGREYTSYSLAVLLARDAITTRTDPLTRR